MDLICGHLINFKNSILGDERFTKALFPLKSVKIPFMYQWNELGKIEEKTWYKTFLLVWRAATCTCIEVQMYIATKEGVYISKEPNSHRICLGHQHGCPFIVLDTNMVDVMSCEKALYFEWVYFSSFCVVFSLLILMTKFTNNSKRCRV